MSTPSPPTLLALLLLVLQLVLEYARRHHPTQTPLPAQTPAPVSAAIPAGESAYEVQARTARLETEREVEAETQPSNPHHHRGRAPQAQTHENAVGANSTGTGSTNTSTESTPKRNREDTSVQAHTSTRDVEEKADEPRYASRRTSTWTSLYDQPNRVRKRIAADANNPFHKASPAATHSTPPAPRPKQKRTSSHRPSSASAPAPAPITINPLDAFKYFQISGSAKFTHQRTDHPLLAGTSPLALVLLVTHHWINLHQALRWSEARDAFGVGLLELARLRRAGRDVRLKEVEKPEREYVEREIRRWTEVPPVDAKNDVYGRMGMRRDELRAENEKEKEDRRRYGALGRALAHLATPAEMAYVVRGIMDMSVESEEGLSMSEGLREVMWPVLVSTDALKKKVRDTNRAIEEEKEMTKRRSLEKERASRDRAARALPPIPTLNFNEWRRSLSASSSPATSDDGSLLASPEPDTLPSDVQIFSPEHDEGISLSPTRHHHEVDDGCASVMEWSPVVAQNALQLFDIHMESPLVSVRGLGEEDMDVDSPLASPPSMPGTFSGIEVISYQDQDEQMVDASPLLAAQQQRAYMRPPYVQRVPTRPSSDVEMASLPPSPPTHAPVPSISVFPPVLRAPPVPRAQSAFTRPNPTTQLPYLRQALQRLLSSNDTHDLAPYEPEPEPETNTNANAHDARYPAHSYPIPEPSYPNSDPDFAPTPSSSPRRRPSLLDRISSPPAPSSSARPQTQAQGTPAPAPAVQTRHGRTRSNALLAPPSSVTQASPCAVAPNTKGDTNTNAVASGSGTSSSSRARNQGQGRGRMVDAHGYPYTHNRSQHAQVQEGEGKDEEEDKENSQPRHPAICRFFLRGDCRNGSHCKFAHPSPAPAPTPALDQQASASTSASISASAHPAHLNAPKEGWTVEGASPTRFSDSDETFLGEGDGEGEDAKGADQVQEGEGEGESRRVTEEEAVDFLNNLASELSGS